MGVLGKLLDQRGVLVRANDRVHAELVLEEPGLRLGADEGGDLEGARARVREQAVEDRASDISCAMT